MKRIFKPLITVILLFSAQFAWSLTLSEIRTEIRRNVRDTATVATLRTYSDTTLNTLINQAQDEIVNQTWCVTTSTSYALLASTSYYNLPTDFIAPEVVTFAGSTGVSYELKEAARRSFIQQNPDWLRQRGPPAQYIIQQSLSGGNPLLISYYPIPSSTQIGTVTITYYKQVDDLSSDSDVPFDGLNHLYPFHRTIVYEVTAKLKFIEGLSAEGSTYIQLYQSDLAIMAKRLSTSPNYSPGIVAGPAR